MDKSEAQRNVDEAEITLRVIENWKQVADNEVDNIGAWRNVDANERGYLLNWGKMPNGFWGDTTYLLSQITLKYPNLNLNPTPIQTIYSAIEAWYKDHNASRIPPQNQLEGQLALAMQLVSILQQDAHDKMQRVNNADLASTKPAETTQNTSSWKKRISNFFWTLYEKTLKIVVDAVLEKKWHN